IRLGGIETELNGNEGLMIRKGAMQNEIKNITQEERSSRLRLEKETKVESMKIQSKKWAALIIAQVMMKKAMRKYEEERQPGVIKEAE
ncbi:MAG: hypothetical protein Q7J68_02065, partial [Thermoplasmata archaeon]|nr:hypothetical protein [Thermoplasmata archaeon]